MRVERQGSNIKRIPNERLQSKGDSDYFKEVSQYHPRKIYVSNINLNREYGEIQLPYTPTQRVAMPVFRNDNVFFGMVVINLDARYQIDSLVNNLNADLTLYLLNNKGGYVRHPDDEQSFLFEFDKQSRWDNEFTKRIKAENTNTLTEVTHIPLQNQFYFSSQRILLSGLEEGRYLTLIIGTVDAVMNTLIYQRILITAQIMAILLSVVYILFSIAQVNVHKRLILMRDQAEFKAIVSGSDEGIISMDQQGVIKSWNNAATEITGFTKQVAQGQTMFDLFLDPDSSSVNLTSIIQFFKKSEPIIIECKAKSRKNDSLILTLNLSPIILDNGKTIGVAALFSDITERKKIEEDILQLNTSLEEKVKSRTKQLEEARNQALDASSIKSEFIANVSHEIRTPMNGVLGMLELLAKDGLTARQQHQLEMAKFSAKHLTHLVNDILDMSKIEAGKLEIEEENFNLLHFLSDIATSLAIRAQDKGIELILDTSGIQDEHVLGDAMRINQIITNLVGNALKFTKEGEIVIHAKTDQQNDGSFIFTCRVSDTGKGIDAQKLNKLFESFTQENSSISKEFGGTGLGLTISRQLCQLMGGTINVESQPEEGSTFYFEVPFKLSNNATSELLTCHVPEANILVASPNPRVVSSIASQLRVFGCQVVTAYSVSEMQNTLHNNEAINLILLDDQLAKDTLETLLGEFQSESVETKSIYILENSKDSLSKQHNLPSIMKPATPLSLIYCLNTVFSHNNDAQEAARIHPSNQDDSLKGYRVLVVDDNQINLEVAKGVLEDFELDISVADSAQSCFNWIENEAFDFILMDCQMPIMDGYTATGKIRNGDSGDQNKDLIIIAMTAHAMTGAKDICMNAGMNDYIPKPIDAERIRTTLLKWTSSLPKDHHAKTSNHAHQALYSVCIGSPFTITNLNSYP